MRRRRKRKKNWYACVLKFFKTFRVFASESRISSFKKTIILAGQKGLPGWKSMLANAKHYPGSLLILQKCFSHSKRKTNFLSLSLHSHHHSTPKYYNQFQISAMWIKKGNFLLKDEKAQKIISRNFFFFFCLKNFTTCRVVFPDTVYKYFMGAQRWKYRVYSTKRHRFCMG